MPTFPSHFLLMAISLPFTMASPESPSGTDWPTAVPPPGIPFPLMGEGGKDFYPLGENMTGQPAGSMEAYCEMLLQAENAIPPEQIPWFCMCTKCQSNPGPKGDRGDRGLPGHPGSPGRRGMTGFRGPPGFMGRQGVKGQKGDDGEKGHQGAQGLVGPKGSRGFKGDKGDRGFEGLTGDQGPKGDDGVCPDTCEASQGPIGPAGLPGPAGPRGVPGVKGQLGPKGNMGDKGDLGGFGFPGRVGEKGEQGPQGDCNCTDGVDGEPGQKGDKGDMGKTGDIGFKGQTGTQGPKGEIGDMGMAGLPGPCMPTFQSAFSARLTSSYPPPNAPVIFAAILYNVQGSYDPSIGIYTAPVNGTYVFNYHVTIYERILKIGIFLNFRPVVKNTDSRVLGTTSHSVILHLVQGDMVWVQVKDEVTNGMFVGIDSSSTFSGFLLHPDTCDMPSFRNFISPTIPPDQTYKWDDDDSD